ncbi:MAG: TfoX family protein [Alphaproteobacteria bacterium]|nr:MAG: TfoX family protein [Alphaproteobacteria bacterium]
MAVDPHLVDQLRDVLSDQPGITEKKMFGGICFMLNGNMLLATRVGRFMFRVGKEAEADALEMPGAEPMQHGKRRMPGFIWVDAGEAIEEGLEKWVALALRYVSGLPVK